MGEIEFWGKINWSLKIQLSKSKIIILVKIGI
jgi:hypothetical protein